LRASAGFDFDDLEATVASLPKLEGHVAPSFTPAGSGCRIAKSIVIAPICSEAMAPWEISPRPFPTLSTRLRPRCTPCGGASESRVTADLRLASEFDQKLPRDDDLHSRGKPLRIRTMPADSSPTST